MRKIDDAIEPNPINENATSQFLSMPMREPQDQISPQKQKQKAAKSKIPAPVARRPLAEV